MTLHHIKKIHSMNWIKSSFLKHSKSFLRPALVRIYLESKQIKCQLISKFNLLKDICNFGHFRAALALKSRSHLSLFQAYAFSSSFVGLPPFNFSAISKRKISNFGMIVEIHRLEKCLTSLDFAPHHAQESFLSLLMNTIEYSDKHGSDPLVQYSFDTLATYLIKNRSFSFSKKNSSSAIEIFPKSSNNILSSDYLQHSLNANDFYTFFNSRYSVRGFDKNKVLSIDIIKQAIKVSQKTPSVCNRQSWKTFILASDAAKLAALHYQNGSRGFGESSSFILVVATDMRAFATSTEIFQPYVEGGLFSMSLMLALHANHVSTCPLNWCVAPETDQKFKNEVDIPQYFCIAMLIAVGYSANDVTIAESRRLTCQPICDVR